MDSQVEANALISLRFLILEVSLLVSYIGETEVFAEDAICADLRIAVWVQSLWIVNGEMLLNHCKMCCFRAMIHPLSNHCIWTC